MSVRTHLVVWLVSTLVIILINVFVLNKSTVEEFNKERVWTNLILGENDYKIIKDRSLWVYGYCCVPLATITAEVYVEPVQDDDSLAEFMTAIHTGFWTTIYLAIQRFWLVLEWYYYFSFLIIGFMLEGVVKRRIRKNIKAWSSPLIFDIGWHINIGVFGMFLIYLFWPWAIYPLVSLFWIVLISFSLYLIFANIQQRI